MVGRCISFWDRWFSKAMLVSESVSRLQICPLYIFGNKATDGTYRSKYWFPGFGFDSFAKATALCSYRISFFCVYETGGPTFSTSLGQATFRGVAQRFLGSGEAFQRNAGPTFDWTSLVFWNRKTYEIWSNIINYPSTKTTWKKTICQNTQWFLPTTLSPPNFWEGLTTCVLWSSKSVNTSNEK